jgi:methyltransferase-like protein/SAM-dependent methyltransferase
MPLREPVLPPVSTSYDEVPYENLAFAQTHPDRLATIARIFGLSPADIARARVLELGCASGGNLIPMALNLPGSTFVGVDLSRRQVAEANETIAALGLRNIAVEHASILDVDDRWGVFDYIICHGVFSWVEPPVQDKILAICASNLARDGVAYVSYNTYPGWHLREMVRDMMRYHAAPFDRPRDQIVQARALLDFLADCAPPDSGPYGQLLHRELERLRHSSDAYLFHEHLEHSNTPMYFHQFAARAERAGLQYLCEAEFLAVLSYRFPPAIAATLERLSADILHVEQYMDFVRNREFRQTLLCHATLPLQRALGPPLMHGLLASCPASLEPADVPLQPGSPVTIRLASKHGQTDAPWTKAALRVLVEQWPKAVDVDDLCAVALDRASPFAPGHPPDALRRALMEELFQCFVAGLMELRTTQPGCTNVVPEKPVANVLAAYQAARTDRVVNARHEIVTLDKMGREVLRLANGQRGKREMLNEFIDLAVSGGLTVEMNDARVDDRAALSEILSRALDATLASLTRAALFAEQPSVADR